VACYQGKKLASTRGRRGLVEITAGRGMKNRTYFAHRIDMLDAAGEIQEHLAGVEDYLLAEAVWREAIARWPKAVIILRQGARVVHDSRRPREVK
jgi:hypothetical protein